MSVTQMCLYTTDFILLKSILAANGVLLRSGMNEAPEAAGSLTTATVWLTPCAGVCAGKSGRENQT